MLFGTLGPQHVSPAWQQLSNLSQRQILHLRCPSAPSSRAAHIVLTRAAVMEAPAQNKAKSQVPRLNSHCNLLSCWKAATHKVEKPTHRQG